MPVTVDPDHPPTVRMESLSHELRTPLTDILGMAHLLDDTVLEQDQKEYVQAIMRASHELLVHVDNHLDQAQLNNDALGVQEEYFGITEALLVMVERLRPSAAAKGLGISLEFAPDIGTKIHCDKARLSQAVYNLAAHLIARHSDGILRMAANIREGQWSDTLHVTITSNARFNGTSVQESDNVDVLEITRRLARLMGGEVSLDMDENQSEYGQLTILVETPKEEAGQIDRPARILVAEDSRANQRLIGLILNKLGHDFELVANGIEAVEAVRNNHFDMVLMDLHMPQMDGMAACQKIRELDDEISALVPVIALTADVRPEMPAKVLEAGMDAYLTKPLDVTKLSETIQASMSTTRVRKMKLAKTA
ncbi:MAG: response regulator [Robiginitomaculum sp.]|nr:response regulator [Robiginitomaculum sp.]MDQ7076250.1 response regulator [Robiginitomaculum sp.]